MEIEQGVSAPNIDRAIVIGGGVVGICSAYHLLRRGYRVTLVEKRNVCARECSNAMAGGMQRMIAGVNAGMVKEALKNSVKILSSEKFQYFRLGPSTLFDPHFIRWFSLFSRGARSRDPQEATNQLKFTCWSIDLMEQAMSHIRVNDVTLGELSSYSKSGVIKLLSSAEYNEREQTSNFNWTQHLEDGEETTLITKHQVFSNFPWLSSSLQADNIGGALFQLSAASAQGNWFAEGLLNHCTKEYPNALEIRSNTSVEGFESKNNCLTLIKTDKGEIPVAEDTPVVFCAGSWTPILFRKMNLYIPVYPLKGYTLALDLSKSPQILNSGPEQVLVNGPLYVCRYANQLRISSIGELAGWNTKPFPPIEKSLREEAKKMLPKETHSLIDSSPIVCGLRPYVADGNILIGNVHDRYKNVFVNVGPGFNGWKVSFGSGELLARIIDRYVRPRSIEKATPLNFDESCFSPKSYIKYSPVLSRLLLVLQPRKEPAK